MSPVITFGGLLGEATKGNIVSTRACKVKVSTGNQTPKPWLSVTMSGIVNLVQFGCHTRVVKKQSQIDSLKGCCHGIVTD